MSNQTSFKTIEDFLFQKGKIFVVPNYQRGYKWAVKEKEKPSAVEKLLDDLFNAGKEQPYFLQGVTVCEEKNNIILIDGQQRTTTLYLLLWCLEKSKIADLNLVYDIREQSKEFINNLKNASFDYLSFDTENKHQDIFYFKKAIEQINAKIEDYTKKIKFDKTEFVNFLFEKVTILYIVIDKEKATKTFTMMNGSKATMLQEELVKAEMLRVISLPEIIEKKVSTSVDDNLFDLKEIISKDWETNALRSRYSREWDKWLYWWNREEVKDFFGIQNPMGLLLEYYDKYKSNENRTDFSFDNFRVLISGKLETKKHFNELRDLQKSFEDIFNTPTVYNYLGLALNATEKKEKYEIINYFIGNKDKAVHELESYAKWRLIGATHIEITNKGKFDSEKEEKAQIFLNNLKNNFAYLEKDTYETAYKYLLWLNVKEDNKLCRKFNFSICKEKSLEHIFPKSKVFHQKEDGSFYTGNNDTIRSKPNENDKSWLNRENFEKNKGSEHCIGNLVLLYGKNNSEFGAKPVFEKKKVYFDISKNFTSRHLLHTISVFAKDNWGITEIQENFDAIIKQFIEDFNIKIHEEK